MTPADTPVVFFHVMKCGGTSVRAGLAAAATPRSGAQAVFELDGTAAKAAAGGTDADNWAFRDALLHYVLEAMPPSVVLGHFRYRDRHEALAEAAHFVTVLREPVDRIVSLYKYRRFKEGVDVPVSMSFAEYLDSRRWSKEGHAYVDTFCGTAGLDPRSDEAVAAAVRNLGRFAVIGFTDRLDSFSSRVAARIGRPVSIPMYNTSPAPKDAEVGPADLEHARAVCAPDIRVYEQVLAFAQ
jgi:hypothetical protein